MRRALAILCGALALATAAAADDDSAAGRRIYAKGSEVAAGFAGTSTALPPALRRCAGCHGADGAGTREGGVAIPPVAWSALTSPRESSPARPGRPAYDEAALARALANGIDPAGRALAPNMPRFQLRPAQITALLAYLRVVGSERDLDPGIAADEVRIGAMLPLSGAQAAWGEAMRAGLQAAFDAAGPLYGRRMRLVAADAGEPRRVAAGEEVFAYLATMLPDDTEADDVPVIAPLIPTPAVPEPHRFYLLSSIEDQLRVLVDELASETPHPLRLAVVGPSGSAADAVADAAVRNSGSVVRRAEADDLAAALEPAPDAVLALPGADLGRLAAQLTGGEDRVLLAGLAEAIALGAATDPRLRLALPLLPSDRSHAQAGPPLAHAAAAVLIEGLKRMGGRPSRAGLIAALETLRDFPTPGLPPLNFAPGQHAGSRASVVIRPDPRQGMVMLGGWRVPR